MVAAERELARCRAEFYQHAQSRAEVLSAALEGGAWEIGSALEFLRVLPDDTPALLPQLVGHALSHRRALDARQAIGAARAQRDRLLPALKELILPRLDAADDDEYRRYAELLAHVEGWDVLRQVTQRALASDDPDTREVGEDFTRFAAWKLRPSSRGGSAAPPSGCRR